MIFQELAWHLWLYFDILWEKLKINWEAWEKGMRKIFSDTPVLSPEIFKRHYQEYPHYH